MSGALMANDEGAARQILEARGWKIYRLAAQNVEEAPQPSWLRQRSPSRKLWLRLSRSQAASLLDQLNVLLSSGTPLLRALHMLALGGELAAAVAADKLCDAVEKGLSFSEACRTLPGCFPPELVRTLEVAEHHGAMSTVLQLVVQALREEAGFSSRLVNAVSYPLVLLFICLVLTAGMIYGMLPPFIEIFRDTGLPVPPLTQAVFSMTRFPWLSLGFSLCLLALTVHVARAVLGRQTGRTEWMRHLPGLGAWLFQRALLRVCQNLALMLDCGLPLLEGLKILARQCPEIPELQQALERCEAEVRNGQTLSQGLGSPCIPPALRHLVAAGEESGKTSTMIRCYSAFIEDHLRTSLAQFLTVVEPLCLFCLSVVVGTVLLACFLPLLSLPVSL